MKPIFAWMFVVSLMGCVFVTLSHEAFGQEKSRVMPLSTYKVMLNANKQTGWVSFRNYAGKQWVYFTALQTLHCRLKEIRYSINSSELDQRFNIVPCNPQNPFALPPNSKPSDIALALALGTAKTVAVQVVWETGEESAVAVYEPCKDVGEQTCSWPVK